MKTKTTKRTKKPDGRGRPSVNLPVRLTLRLTEQEHAELTASAQDNNRVINAEIRFRCFKREDA